MFMWYFGVGFMTLVTIATFHFTYKWRNPVRNTGKLPPGSMGLPLIGETIQFLIPSKSLDIPPFIARRIKKYGKVFRTSLVGRSVVVSSDPDFNHYIFQQEGKLVELGYLDSFNKLVGITDTAEDGFPINGVGFVHKYLRNVALHHFGPEILKEKLLPELEEMVNQTFRGWNAKESVEVKRETSAMVFKSTSQILFGYEPEKSGEDLSEKLNNFVQGVMAIPLDIPGTTFHRFLRRRKRVTKLIRETIEERRAHPEKRRGDFLDHIMDDMKIHTFLTDKSITYITFGLLLASFETISATLTLAMMLLSEHPLVVEELVKENEEILRTRGNKEAGMRWEEYKSMTFTMHVVNETLRLASVAPGILRKAIADVQVKGYTIPKGWTIFVVPSAVQLNPDTYEDPLAFNPWRWKDLRANVTAKNFIAFGGGMRQCAGAEFSRVFMAVFLHVIVTKYRWTKVKGGEIIRSPALAFGSGYHIKVTDRSN